MSSEPTDPKSLNPYTDPLVAELMQSPAIAKMSRLHFLLAAAAMLDQASTSTMPKIGERYDQVLELTAEETDKPRARVFVNDGEVWPKGADEYTIEDAESALVERLRGREQGAHGRVEHYDGDFYNIVASYVVGASGIPERQERKAA